MKKILFLLLPACLLACSQKTSVCFLDRIPAQERHNCNYVSTVDPLVPQPLVKLPSGTVKPEGWIKTLLQLQRDGLNGHLMEISAWLQRDGNAWLNEGGKWGWEEVPYWLKGYAECAYLLGDEKMLEETRFWIDAMLASQKEDGSFGPSSLQAGQKDLWPNMIVLWILQNYYEYSLDSRVLDFMSKYFHWQLTIPDEIFVKDYWGSSRIGDNLWSVIWLYSRTGDKSLLELADKLHRNSADWTKSTELPNWHCVNIAQGFREPATAYMTTGDSILLRSSYNVYRFIRQVCGHFPGGMYAADENARLGFIDPRQGIEVCAMAEQMGSDELMLMFTSDPLWAENIEDVLFNSYPSAFSPDMKALRYLTAANLVRSDTLNHAPGINNSGKFLCINPFSCRCCQHNHGFALPYYANHLLYATQDNGLAALLFNSFSAEVRVADGKRVTVKSVTDYPFDETVKYEFNCDTAVVFPFYVRVPSWTESAVAQIGAECIDLVPGTYVKLEREWNDGDKLLLRFPMHLSSRKWAANKNSVSVDYGPLTLSLKIDEITEKVPANQHALWDSKWQENADSDSWPAYNILPGSKWNYAIDPLSVTLVSKTSLKEGVNPFTQENMPILFKANGKEVPVWKIDRYNLCDVLPYDDDKRSDKFEEIFLIPMGAARLRISAFPCCN